MCESEFKGEGEGEILTSSPSSKTLYTADIHTTVHMIQCLGNHYMQLQDTVALQ